MPQYGVYLLAAAALRVWWLTRAHDVFDIVVLAIGLAVVVSRGSAGQREQTAHTAQLMPEPCSALRCCLSVSCCFWCQLYILYLLFSFVWTVCQLREEERVLLQAYSNWDFGYYSPVIVMPVIVAAPDFMRPAGYQQQQPYPQSDVATADEGQKKEGMQQQPPQQPAAYRAAGTFAASPPKASKGLPPSVVV